MFIPIRSMRKRLRARLLTQPNSVKMLESCLMHAQRCEARLSYLENLIKNMCRVTAAPPAVGNVALAQMASAAILAKFAQIMEKHQLPWWLDGGALIGHRRHGGFVPWDDDVDISILREHYEKLPRIFDEEFKDGEFTYRGGEIIQIYYKNTRIFLDVFPMDIGGTELPPEGAEREKFISTLKEIQSHMKFDHKKWAQRQQPVSNEYLQFCREQRTARLVPNPISTGFIFFGVETGLKDRSLIPQEVIFPLKKEKFVGIEVYVPRCAERYLTIRYGDYNEWPRKFGGVHDSSYVKKMTWEEQEECREAIHRYLPQENIHSETEMHTR